jgi:hypothetical protein
LSSFPDRLGERKVLENFREDIMEEVALLMQGLGDGLPASSPP